MMACLLVTFLVFISYYLLFSSTSSETRLRKILLSFLLSCAQILMTELTLGLFHGLYASYLTVVNLSVATLLLTIAYRSDRGPFLSVLKTDYAGIRHAVGIALDVYTVSLGILFLTTYAWILTASYCLPPRGVDDLTYHLPVILEYVQSHEIKLLPVELRTHFAFPENAELLFMWPVLFSKSQRMMNGPNVLFVLISMLTVYALIRHFGISRKDSFFAAMLYAMCPVVVMQAGVNYVDVLVSLVFLLGLYFSALFHSERRLTYLFAAGVSIGLMLGMKYTALFLALPLQLLIIPGLLKVKRRYAAGYAALVALLCGWWYLRNLVVLKDPFFPMNLLGLLLGKHGEGRLIGNVILNAPHWMSRYLIDDIGIGTYDGGFGLVFWGVGFSSWLYFTAYSLLHYRKTGLARFVVLAYVPVGFLLLLMNPDYEVLFVGRFSIFVVAVGLFCFCETLKILDDTFWASTIKTVCTGLSVFMLCLLFVADKPSYNFTDPVWDMIHNHHPSPFKYSMNSIPTQQYLRYVWEPLDFLTRDDRDGLNCCIITDKRLFAPAPVYGSNLQNHVLYPGQQTERRVDAYVVTFYPKDGQNDALMAKSPAGMFTDGQYVIVSHSERGCLLLHKRIYDDPAKQRLLRKYYQMTWPEAIIVAKQIEPLFEENIPVITSSQVGYGLRYIDMLAHNADRISIVPEFMEEKVAAVRHIDRCYTLGKPLPGYSYKKIWTAVYNNATVAIYLNRKI